MKTEKNLPARLACALILALTYLLPAQAQDKPCLVCHAALADKKVVHAAVRMGCASCHADIDASAMPHKVKGKIAKGLSAEAPALCANCHEKALFEGKVVHIPVAGGMCLGCHNPHTSDHSGLLNKDPATLCLDCHPDIKTRSHAGFTRGQHPLGFESVKRADPLRAGKQFYCAACHEPHRSERPKLNRFAKGMGACQQCHKMGKGKEIQLRFDVARAGFPSGGEACSGLFRMYELQTCEIPVLWRSGSAVWSSASSVCAMPPHLDGPSEKARASCASDGSDRPASSPGGRFYACPILFQAAGR